MSDREKVIEGLTEISEYVLAKADIAGIGKGKEVFDSWYRSVEDALALLREQDEERTRIVSWLGKFCAHVDQRFQPLPDEQNIEFFREKMKQQFGWEVSGDD